MNGARSENCDACEVRRSEAADRQKRTNADRQGSAYEDVNDDDDDAVSPEVQRALRKVLNAALVDIGATALPEAKTAADFRAFAEIQSSVTKMIPSVALGVAQDGASAPALEDFS